MVVEARLAARIGLAQAGLAEEVSSILSGLGLPTTIPQGIKPKDLAGAIGFDKKRRNGEVRFALPRRVGEMEVGVRVDGWQEILGEG
jgi:3-dehydroquinate synthetase